MEGRSTDTGAIRLLSIVWEDGIKYDVTRIRHCERCESRKEGGTGLVYTCIISGKEILLYFEGDLTGARCYLKN